MEKIPVKIIQYTISGETRKNVMLDILDTYDIDGDPEEKIKEFKKKYFELVEKARKVFYGENTDEKKKYQNLSSFVYYKIGKLIYNFNKSIENEFKITNYAEAISRDFGLSQDYILDLLIIVQTFKKDEIIKSVPFSYYRALKRKRSVLTKLGILEQEKKRLNKMGNQKKLPGRENYKKELDILIKSKKEKQS